MIVVSANSEWLSDWVTDRPASREALASKNEEIEEPSRKFIMLNLPEIKAALSRLPQLTIRLNEACWWAPSSFNYHHKVSITLKKLHIASFSFTQHHLCHIGMIIFTLILQNQFESEISACGTKEDYLLLWLTLDVAWMSMHGGGDGK